MDAYQTDIFGGEQAVTAAPAPAAPPAPPARPVQGSLFDLSTREELRLSGWDIDDNA
ncbi:hypothetical protein GCM10018962_77370 [Dactylosporangium matsuzakiense]|uniref:hypothetical protein n=1 Tax=Dactylosporangium matsuzakiense TaxID=53360 RepID=UPI0031ED274E